MNHYPVSWPGPKEANTNEVSTNHDPLCPSELPRSLPPAVGIDGKAVAYVIDNPGCQCALIVRVRADERARIIAAELTRLGQEMA